MQKLIVLALLAGSIFTVSAEEIDVLFANSEDYFIKDFRDEYKEERERERCFQIANAAGIIYNSGTQYSFSGQEYQVKTNGSDMRIVPGGKKIDDGMLTGGVELELDESDSDLFAKMRAAVMAGDEDEAVSIAERLRQRGSRMSRFPSDAGPPGMPERIQTCG